MKRFLQMFLASVAIFLILAHLDEYENLITPLLKRRTEETRVHRVPELDEVREFIQGFSRRLSQAYLASDPDIIVPLLSDDLIKSTIADDMKFLTKSGKVMDITVDDIVVEGVEWFSSTEVRVKTRERVSLSYLSLSDRTVVMPKKVAEYQMVYTLKAAAGGWFMVGYETVGVKEAGSNG